MKIKAEDLLARQLTADGIGYEREFVFHPVRKWRADFRISLTWLLVEVEGIGYTPRMLSRHQHGRGYEEDCIKYNSAVLEGWDVLRFTPDMVFGRGTGARKRKQPPAIEIIKQYLALFEDPR